MDTNEKRAVLSQSTLFDNLLTTELTMLADLFVAKDYEAGELVFDEGVVGDSMYVIESGSVEVLRKNPQGEYQQIAVLGDKKFFGEMSLIDKEYRSATVRAKESARCCSSQMRIYTFSLATTEMVYLGCCKHRTRS